MTARDRRRPPEGDGDPSKHYHHNGYGEAEPAEPARKSGKEASRKVTPEEDTAGHHNGYSHPDASEPTD